MYGHRLLDNKQKTKFYATNGQLHSLDNIMFKNKLILINKSYPEHLATLLFFCSVIYDSSSLIYITNSSWIGSSKSEWTKERGPWRQVYFYSFKLCVLTGKTTTNSTELSLLILLIFFTKNIIIEIYWKFLLLVLLTQNRKDVTLMIYLRMPYKIRAYTISKLKSLAKLNNIYLKRMTCICLIWLLLCNQSTGHCYTRH